MDISHLQEFVTFSRHMSVTEAARHLHIAQSTLSNHIAAMERDFGCDLVARGKTMQLTPAGRELVSYASEILDVYARMRTAVGEANARSFKLTVAAETMGNCTSADYTNATIGFLARNRNVEIAPFPGTAPEARAILDEGADCVLVSVQPLKADVEAGVLHVRIPSRHPSRLHLWMSRESRLASRSSLKWGDLDGKYPMSRISVPLWVSCVTQILEEHDVAMDIRTNAQTSMYNLLEVKDDEYVLLDEYAARSDYVRSIPGRLAVPIDEPDAFSGSYLAYDPANDNPALRLLLDYLEGLEG